MSKIYGPCYYGYFGYHVYFVTKYYGKLRLFCLPAPLLRGGRRYGKHRLPPQISYIYHSTFQDFWRSKPEGEGSRQAVYASAGRREKRRSNKNISKHLLFFCLQLFYSNISDFVLEAQINFTEWHFFVLWLPPLCLALSLNSGSKQIFTVWDEVQSLLLGLKPSNAWTLFLVC